MQRETPGATKVLIADERPENRSQLVASALEWGFNPVAFENSARATEEVSRIQEPWLGLFSDHVWQTAGERLAAIAGALPAKTPGFCLVILDAASSVPSIPADDVLSRPFAPDQLRSRLRLGDRILGLACALHLQSEQLDKARSQLRQLEGMLPICMDCKRIRDEGSRWHPIEHYISARSQASFTHGLCPNCFQKRIEEFHPAS